MRCSFTWWFLSSDRLAVSMRCLMRAGVERDLCVNSAVLNNEPLERILFVLCCSAQLLRFHQFLIRWHCGALPFWPVHTRNFECRACMRGAKNLHCQRAHGTIWHIHVYMSCLPRLLWKHTHSRTLRQVALSFASVLLLLLW